MLTDRRIVSLQIPVLYLITMQLKCCFNFVNKCININIHSPYSLGIVYKLAKLPNFDGVEIPEMWKVFWVCVQMP